MKAVILAAAVGGAMFCGSAALADSGQTMQSAAQSTPATSTADINDQVICASTYHEGEIIKKPICMTRGQIEFQRLQNEQQIRELQERSLLGRPH